MKSYASFRIGRIYRRLGRGYTALLRFSHSYIFRRTKRLREVQRFSLVWIGLLALTGFSLFMQFKSLKAHYLTLGPRPSGTLTEGVVGEINSINPLFPEGSASNSAARLIFSSLMHYDATGQLKPHLAQEWTVDEEGLRYRFKLRTDVVWHDGHPFTARDVVYTYRVVQNPDTRSPLNSVWRDIKITAVDDHTVEFVLPNPYTPFPHSLTTGIVPEHILGAVTPDNLRKVEFNQKPIGTGPFKFEEFVTTQEELRLSANENYFLGEPRLDNVVLRSFENYEAVLDAYRNNLITAAAGFRSFDIEELEGFEDAQVHRLALPSQVFAFFNTTKPALKDVALRQALVGAVDHQAISQALGYRYELAHSALLPEHLGYTVALHQLDTSLEKAQKLLDEAGWKPGAEGIRFKDNKPLKLQIVTQNTDAYPAVATALQQQWRKLGVQLEVKVYSADELQNSYIRSRNYDILLFGITLGADPDSFAYWHSSQGKDPGLNLSGYQSEEADLALEAGRTRQEKDLREVKYQAFLKEWRQDAPALALYRPYYFYTVKERVFGVDIEKLIDPTDRFYNVHQWTVNTQPILKRL